jgi:hypothetical protein
MKLKTAQRIRECWDALNDDDISTEMLFALTAEAAGVEYGDVATGLYMTRTPEEIKATH